MNIEIMINTLSCLRGERGAGAARAVYVSITFDRVHFCLSYFEPA